MTQEKTDKKEKAAGERVDCEGVIHVLIVFCPPDKRRRDLDGCLSGCKAYLDGLADGLKVDDSRFRPSLDWGPVVKGGEVRIFLKKGEL